MRGKEGREKGKEREREGGVRERVDRRRKVKGNKGK